MLHEPVLLKEVIENLNLSSGSTVIDATLGLGGHTRAILENIDGSQIIGIDRDNRNIELAKTNLKEFGDRVTYLQDSFGNMMQHDIGKVDAILFDLGYSSVHVDDASRGFSFQKEGPLDMRYDTGQELTAEQIINGWPKEDLARIFRIYGEETLSNQIAKAIFDSRRKERIVTTTQLAEIVASCTKRRGKIHPATKVFQALRIVVNDEFGEIERGLESAASMLKKDGRLAVISFHSLEDRIVKKFLKEASNLEVITKKPIRPHFNEVKHNPRARSAKLRIAQKQ